MKKILSIIGAISIVGSGVSAVLACSNSSSIDPLKMTDPKKGLTRNTSIPDVELTTSVYKYETETNSNIFFVGTKKGLYSSSDGKKWNVINVLKSKDITSISQLKDKDDNSLYFAGTTSGLWTSKDGVTWTADKVVTGKVTTTPVKTVFKSFQTTVITYFIGTSNGLYSSSDGKNWTEVGGQLGGLQITTNVYFVAIPEGGGVQPTYFVGTNSSGMFQSDDGAIWDPITEIKAKKITTNVVFYRLDYVQKYAGKYNIGTDQGVWSYNGTPEGNWGQATQLPANWNVTNLPSGEIGSYPALFIGTTSGLFRSAFLEDKLINTRVIDAPINSTVAIIDKSALVATSKGLYYSADEEKTWNLYPGLPNNMAITAKPVQLDGIVDISTDQGLYYSDGDLGI